jgi:RelB Antitoxin alpha helical domain
LIISLATTMLDIHKQYVMDENQQPLAVQIPVAVFDQIEEILENFGLVKLMAEVEDGEVLAGEEALTYYQANLARRASSN